MSEDKKEGISCLFWWQNTLQTPPIQEQDKTKVKNITIINDKNICLYISSRAHKSPLYQANAPSNTYITHSIQIQSIQRLIMARNRNYTNLIAI